MACAGGVLATSVTFGGSCAISAAGDAVSKVGNDVFSSIASYFGSVAASATAWLWTQLNQATSVDITSEGIHNDLVATGAIAATITFGLFLIQVIASAIRQDFSGLGRAVRGIAVAFIGAAFAVAVTQILLAAVDALCNGVVQYALGSDLAGMGSKLIAVTALTTISNPAGQLLMALILLVAVVTVWAALMTRKMLIIIAAVFAPIAFSGSASDISQSWVKRWIEFTVALVFSKLILVIIFMIGLSVLSGAGTTTATGAGTVGGAGQDITNLAIGALILLMAGFAPWMAIKMVHFAGDSFHAIHAQAGAATAGAQQAAAMPQKVAAPLSKMGSAGKPASGSGSGVPAPQQKPASATPTDRGAAPTTAPTTAPTAAPAVAPAAAPAVGAGGGGASAAAAGPAAPVAAAAVAAVGAMKSAANNAAGQAQDAGQSAAGNSASPPRPPKSA